MSYTLTDSKQSSFDAETCTLMSEVEMDGEACGGQPPTVLPWGAPRERAGFPEAVHISTALQPGEFVLQSLFAEFAVLAERKIDQVLESPNKEKPLSKCLQRGEDATLDQVLLTLSSVAENCLPSLLETLFNWHERQIPTDDFGLPIHRQHFKNKGEFEHLSERRDLAVDFIFCLVLIEVLKQLPYHPGHDDLVNKVINQAFKHFKYKEGAQTNPNATNINIVADLYAEVIGAVAQSRFAAVRQRFMTELKELRAKDQNHFTIHSIISCLMGMKFFRVKMHPIEEFQACFQFLHELGAFFMEIRDRDVKQALAGLFVEILLPVAASVKNEVNVPVLKNFVETMYIPSLEWSAKRKHTLALPTVTCLLCVSQKQFFLNNWPSFLGQCLARLRDRDQKMARVALESLYRLLWVYMIRIKCESNTQTTSRLQSIVSSLFPKGSKLIIPKDAPLSIFVKIIQFISQERLDFAMKEIIYDLLCVGKNIKTNFSPERMSIGLRAFLVIADSLQQRDGVPPMPQTMGVLPSGNTLRFKKTFINKYLSEETARSIGMAGYYANCRKAFDGILKYLDSQVGKQLLMIRTENINREPEEIITGERKPKIDLFRTCVAAIPRLLPDGMTRQDLIELLSRLTVHMDDELGKLAFQSLQNMVVDLKDWRNEVLHGFVQFIQKDVNDSFPHLIENCTRRLISLLAQWRAAAQVVQNAKERAERKEVSLQEAAGGVRGQAHVDISAHSIRLMSPDQLGNRNTLHTLEGFALVMLCSCKPFVRKLAVIVLKEVRNLFTLLNVPKDGDKCVLDMMDKSCPLIVERVLPHLPVPEKNAVLSASAVDFQWLADRTSVIWTSGGTYHTLQEFSDSGAAPGTATGGATGSGSDPSSGFDPWLESMAIFMSGDFVMGRCSTAVGHAWPVLFTRLQSLYVHIDPNAAVYDSRILRGSKKVTGERDMYLSLWRSYMVMGCCIAPPSQVIHTLEHARSVSPDLNASSPDTPEKHDVRPVSPGMTARELFKIIVPLVKCDYAEMRETIVIALGNTNPAAFRDLVDEVTPLIKDAIEKRPESIKRRKKRDVMRLALVRIFRSQACNGIFAQSASEVVDPVSDSLCATFVEYMDGARVFLETEADKDAQMLQKIRLHFSEFTRHLIRNTSVVKRHKLLNHALRQKLCELFSSWSGHFGLAATSQSKRSGKRDQHSELELSSLQALAAVLTCGPAYNPALLNDDGVLFGWLDTLLGNHDDKIYQLAQETVVLLLEFNPDAQALLDWVIDRCYTGSHQVADGCFNVLAMVFNNREYPCDHVAMLNVTLLNTGSPRSSVRETAVQLLHLLYRRFFLDGVLPAEADGVLGEDRDAVFLRHSSEQLEKRALQDMLLSGPYSRPQLCLSETLALLHPELTMPMFSEITHRFQTAIPSVQQTLLQYLLPWLHNMELVDPNVPPAGCYGNLLTMKEVTPLDVVKPPLKGEGWGSVQATEMVLNNLFYITAKFGDDHATEIEDLWAALIVCWHNNLPVILRYVMVIVGMAPNILLPVAKQVIVYLGGARPDKLVDELMGELRTIEPLAFNVERTQTAPFYRLTSLKKQQPNASMDEAVGELIPAPALNKGQIHTKRHSAEDPGKLAPVESPMRTTSTTSLRSETSSGSSAANSSRTAYEEEDLVSVRTTTEARRSDSPVPFPLPMPAYGGYFSPLSDMLPESTLPNPPYQRCNLVVMMLTDLVVDRIDIDWTVHLPLMLHIIFLGLDHCRPLIHESCKKLLLNLLLVMSTHNDHFTVSKLVLGYKSISDETAITKPYTKGKDYAILEGSCEGSGSSVGQPPSAVDSLNNDTVDRLPDVDSFETVDHVAKALIEFVLTSRCRPLWNYEDITSKVHNIKSAVQLEGFLKYVLRVFRESLPQAAVEQRWAQEALHLALSCSSRHYAGRSFQVFRALHVPLTSHDLSDILSRLVETVAEQGEDMQGYVTEIMLTLEAAVDNLDVDMRPLMKEIFMSTPNLNKDSAPGMRKSATCVPLRHPMGYSHPNNHFRSTSYSMAVYARRAVLSSPQSSIESRGLSVNPAEPRSHRHSSGDSELRRLTNLSRSRSAQSLKHLQDTGSQDDKLTILSQMLWVAVSMLESDYEYEFLLATRLLDKILKDIQPERPECKDKLDKILQQINWVQFPGVQALLLKGCTSPATAEPTWNLLASLTRSLSAPVLDPSQCEGFPMNVAAMLPYLVEHYEDPNKLCTEAADNIAQVCQEQSQKLCNLGTVMTLYSRGTFAKDSFQWTKCVVKYLMDVYGHMTDRLVAFLVEVLERGPTGTQAAILQILHCIVHYTDVTNCPSQAINADLLRVVAKYIENTNWREVSRIMKLCVMRSSTLSDPPASVSTPAVLDMPGMGLSMSPHSSFAETEVTVKKELPGRTMDFNFDVTQLSIIGSKILKLPATGDAAAAAAAAGPSSGDVTGDRRRGAEAGSLSPGASVLENAMSGWKRPLLSQGRTRERLVNLLNCYGPRVLMPKSPSDTLIHKVIFSHDSPSDTLERQASVTCSSSEEASLADGISGDMKLGDDSSAEQQLQILDSAFDFLDDQDSSCDFFGVKRHSLNMEEEEDITTKGEARGEGDESSDEETQSVSPLEEFPHDLPSCPTITLQNAISMEGVNKRKSICGSIHSIHSASSDLDTSHGEMTDFSPSNASPSFSNMLTLPSPQASPEDDLEDMWRAHTNLVLTDASGSHAVNTFPLFARLFQDTKHRLYMMTKEVCSMLSHPDHIRVLASQLYAVLELTSELYCPLVITDMEVYGLYMSSGRLLERHKFVLLEMNECMDTYWMRRDQVIECLENLKFPDKRLNLVDSPSDVPEEQKLQLCGGLYRLHFQLLQLYETFSKLVVNVAQAARVPGILDLSVDVVELKEELNKAVVELSHGAHDGAPLVNIDPSHMTLAEAERHLVECLMCRDYCKALLSMKALRKVFPADQMLVRLVDDLDGLLCVYCRSQAGAKPGVLAICHPDLDTSAVCTKLMEIKVQMSSAILQIDARTRDQILMRASDSSTL